MHDEESIPLILEDTVEEGQKGLAKTCKGIDYTVYAETFNSEAEVLEKLDNQLNSIDSILFDERSLMQMRKVDLIKCYNMVLNRKELAHKFLLRLADIGIKSDFLTKLSGSVAEEIIEREVSRPSSRVRSMVALLQKAMDAKLEDGYE
jgi:hypothetical protein